MLKHNQYKNDATQLKNFLGLKLPPFFPSPCRCRKKAAISKSRIFSTESRRSYIYCTLVTQKNLTKTHPLGFFEMVKGNDKTL